MLDRLETTLRVRGGARLEGSVATHGAKNAALPIMAAALLAKGTVTLHRVPRITDVSVMWSLLEALGARIRYEGDNTITIDSSNVAIVSRAVRAGAQAGRVVRYRRSAARTVRARRSSAARRLRARHARDRHARAGLRRARLRRAQRARLSDRREQAPPPARRRRSSSACPASARPRTRCSPRCSPTGRRRCKNVAMEPEVVDLANFLIAMGAKIRGQGTDTIVDRRRRRTARRRVRNHSRPHRHRNAAARRRGDARRRDRHRMQSRTPASACSTSSSNAASYDHRRRLDSREGRRHYRRHRYSHRAVSGISDRPAAADGRLPLHLLRARASSKSRSSTRASPTSTNWPAWAPT